MGVRKGYDDKMELYKEIGMKTFMIRKMVGTGWAHSRNGGEGFSRENGVKEGVRSIRGMP